MKAPDRKTLAHWLVRLYPAAWRTRYEAEFHAFLDDMNVQPRDLANLLWTAGRTQLATRSTGRITLAAGLAGLLIGTLVSLRMPDLYVAAGSLRGPVIDGTAISGSLSRSFLAGVIRRDDLYRGERVRLPMEDVVESMRRRIRIARSGDTVAVSFAYPERQAARQATLELMRQIVETERQRRPVGAPGLAILDPPGWPVEKTTPPRALGAAYGLLAGVGLGLLAAVVRRHPWGWTLRLVAGGAAGAALATALSFVAGDRYTSTASVRVQPEAVEKVRSALTRDALGRLIESEHLYPGMASAAAVHALKDRVLIVRDASAPGAPELVRVSFTHSNPLQTMRILNAIIDIWLGATGNPIYARTRPLEVVDRPSYPELPVWPNRLVIALIGLALGLAVVPLRQRRKTANGAL